jgi:hypothetical protein
MGLFVGIARIEGSIDRSGDRTSPQEVIKVVPGPTKPTAVAAIPTAQPTSVAWDMYAPMASAGSDPMVTAFSPATHIEDEQPPEVSDAIVWTSDQPTPDGVIDDDGPVPEGVLTLRGF